MAIITKNREETYKGLVVGKRERPYDLGYDTTYHALVWDWSKMETKLVYYADTRANDNGSCEIDATPEVLEAYEIYKKRIEYNSIVVKKRYETQVPKTGYTCIVKKGRLIPIGTILTIKKTYETAYGVKFIGVDQNGTQYKSYIKNLEVLAVPIDFDYYYPLTKPEYPKAFKALYGTKETKNV